MLHVIANTKQQARQFSSPTPDRFAVLHANMGLHDARLPESQSICRPSRDQDLYSSMSAALCCISINMTFDVPCLTGCLKLLCASMLCIFCYIATTCHVCGIQIGEKALTQTVNQAEVCRNIVSRSEQYVLGQGAGNKASVYNLSAMHTQQS